MASGWKKRGGDPVDTGAMDGLIKVGFEYLEGDGEHVPEVRQLDVSTLMDTKALMQMSNHLEFLSKN